MLRLALSPHGSRFSKTESLWETSILSYLAARPSRNPITKGRQIITQRWWTHERHKYALMVSEAVETECGQGDPEMADRRRSFLKEAALFPVHETILKVAKLLVVPGALPEKAGVDAIQASHGYNKTTICTPEEFF